MMARIDNAELKRLLVLGEKTFPDKEDRAEYLRLGVMMFDADTVKELLEFRSYVEVHPRCFRLLKQGKHFLVVAEKEPYAMKVYAMIKNQEKKQGTWSEADEQAFQGMRIYRKNLMMEELDRFFLRGK
jgi:hypothetical protein